MEKIKKDLMKSLNGMKDSLELGERDTYEQWRVFFDKKIRKLKQQLKIPDDDITEPEKARDLLTNLFSLIFMKRATKNNEKIAYTQLQIGLRWIRDQKL